MLFKDFAAVYLSDFTVNLRSMLCVSNYSSISAKCVSAINTLYYREKYSMPVCIFYFPVILLHLSGGFKKNSGNQAV